MKFILFLLIFLPFSITAQRLVENKVDDFTKKAVKKTSWETICRKGSFWTYAQASKVDSFRYLRFKIMSNYDVYSVNENDELMLKLDNDSIITLKCLKYTISCRGCGSIGLVGSAAPGIEVIFSLNDPEYETLLHRKVVKMRLYTSKGYMEADMKESLSDVLIKELQLIK